MHRQILLLFLVATLTQGWSFGLTSLNLGYSAVEITPPVGWRMARSYSEVVSTGVHDPLYAKAIVWEQAGKKAALVVLDVCSIGREVSDPARKVASELSGIPVSHIVVAATHTHAGPEYYGILRDRFHHEAVQRNGEDPREPLDYRAFLTRRIAEAVVQASSRTRRVTVHSGSGIVEGIVSNRRYVMKDGTVRFNPPRMDPNIERVAGPVDEEFSIALFRTSDGVPVASVSSFPMHVATFGKTEFSGDFPAGMQKNLTRELHEDFFSLFAMGTAGDTNHLQFLGGKATPSTEEISDALTETFLQTLPGLRESDASLEVRSSMTHLPLKELTDSEVEWANAVFQGKWVDDPAFLVKVKAWQILNNRKFRARDGDRLKAEIQVIRLSSDTAIVTLPFEIFVELGLEIKRRSPFQNTQIVTLANDMDFYVPTARAFAEGSYEVVTSPLEPGSGEIVVENAVKLLEEVAIPSEFSRK